MAKVFRSLVDFVTIKDTDDGRPVDRWKSPDILPVLPKNRRFDSKDYISYWVAGAVCASFWSMGGTAIANGLTAAESVVAMIIGAVVCSIVAQTCGEPGIKYHLGFPMMSRATFGMYGSYFVVVIKCFTNFLYCGIQSYWGGLSVHVILAAIFPSYHHMKNTLPESANITTADLIGTVIYMVVFYGVLYIPAYKMNTFFRVSFVAVLITIVSMFIWAMSANHGVRNVVAPGTHLTKAETFFFMVQAVCTLCGSFTGASIRHSDWSRYARDRKAPLIGIWVICPLALTVTAMFGVFVTSACLQMYGEAIWQPVSLLLYIQQHNYSAAARAGTFFGGVGWFLSQLAVNVSLNSVAAGMDLTSVLPKYLNARRGGFLLATVGFVVCPWNYVNSASTFTTVLSAFGLFISPLIGMYIADFWVVRRCNWNVPHLYIGDKTSCYWYKGGYNLLAFGVWGFMIWPSLPGFAMAISGKDLGLPWKRIFQITFFVGMIGGFVFFSILSLLFMPKDARVNVDYDWSQESNLILEAESVTDEEKVQHLSVPADSKNDVKTPL
ncbi:uracil permease [Niveomyces insectorum RCEF 264]|uniref:Uracil permease n=1 Tax=Niveomyces insectorum RCEF 264 TaxID=1081102 RepID=A0A162MGT3_9HYPO|nr:uracil permease [Niveomyces insectorum RCEF 264]